MTKGRRRRDFSGPSGRSLGTRIVTRRSTKNSHRQQDQALLGTLRLLRLQQSARPGQPTISWRQVPFQQQSERHPEQTARSPPTVACPEMQAMGALQRLPTLVHVAQTLQGLQRCAS
jgi:hypothetical protein